MNELATTDLAAGLKAEQDSWALDNQVSNAIEPLPDEAQCPICQFFDVTHPDLRRIMLARDPTGKMLGQARCQCWRQEQQKKAADERRYLQANLPKDFPGGRRLEGFKPPPASQAMFDAVQEFVRGQGPPHVLVLFGGHGCGKSHLIEAALRRMLEDGWQVRYEVAKRYLEKLRHTFGGGQQGDLADLTEWYRNFQVLALDDVGMEKATDFAASEITDLVDERMQYERRTILATNKTRDEMAEHLGDRLASRMYPNNELFIGVKLVISQAGDYRKSL